MEVGSGVARVELQGSLQVGECFLDFTLGRQCLAQDDHRFGREGIIRQNPPALGDRFSGFSGAQQSVGQAEMRMSRHGSGHAGNIQQIAPDSVDWQMLNKLPAPLGDCRTAICRAPTDGADYAGNSGGRHRGAGWGG